MGETYIAIFIGLLIIIAWELYGILAELRTSGDLLQRISTGLFPIPNGGLDMLVYLELIDKKLLEIEKTIKLKSFKP